MLRRQLQEVYIQIKESSNMKENRINISIVNNDKQYGYARHKPDQVSSDNKYIISINSSSTSSTFSLSYEDSHSCSPTPMKIVIRVFPLLRMSVFTFSPSYEWSHSRSPPLMNVLNMKIQPITMSNSWTIFIYHTKHGFTLQINHNERIYGSNIQLFFIT